MIFTTSDSRNKVIVLSEDTYRHICKEHPEFRSKSALIKGVVEDPFFISLGKGYTSTENYWGYDIETGLFAMKYVKIPVDTSKVEGAVKTAFVMSTSKLPADEQIIWHRPRKKSKR